MGQLEAKRAALAKTWCPVYTKCSKNSLVCTVGHSLCFSAKLSGLVSSRVSHLKKFVGLVRPFEIFLELNLMVEILHIETLHLMVETKQPHNSSW